MEKTPENGNVVWWQTAIHTVLWLPLYIIIFIIFGALGSLLNFLQGIGDGAPIGILVRVLLSGFAAHLAIVSLGMLLKRSNKVVASTVIGTLYLVFSGLGIALSIIDGAPIAYIVTNSLSAIAVLVAIILYNLGYRSIEY